MEDIFRVITKGCFTIYIMKRYIIILFFAFKLQPLHSQEVSFPKIFRIDPMSAKGGNVAQLIDEVSFVWLESNSKSAFGTIDQMEATDHYFIILDKQTNQVLIFEADGKFKSKITGKTAGYQKGEYMYRFYFDKVDQVVAIPNNYGTLYFNLDGKFLRRDAQNYSGDRYLFSHDITAFYRYSVDKRLKDSTAYELLLSNGKDIIKRFFPYNTKFASLKSQDIINATHVNFYYKDDTTTFFLKPYDYHIFSFSPDTLYAEYKFIFPAAIMLPPNFSIDSTLEYKRVQYIMEHKETIFGLTNFYKIGNNIFFKVLNYNSGDTYLYNTVSNELYCIEKISPDSSSFFLPVTDVSLGGVDFKNNGILCVNQNYLYTSYSSQVLFRGRDVAEGKAIDYPKRIGEYLKSDGNRFGNPIIVKMKFKTDL